MGVRQARLEGYDEFVAKFEPKRTTDDCLTPPEVYEAVAGYVADRWGVARERMVRPFWPGGDFESFDYPDGCVVVDNPPFSILARIKDFFLACGVRFFLFAPSLTILGGGGASRFFGRVDHIVADVCVTYENGAEVRTGFVTDLEPGVVLEAAPDLGDLVNEANDRALRRIRPKSSTPKYVYPDEVLTAARCQWLAAHGIPLRVRASDCCYIAGMDAQRAAGKSAFGGALLLSERAAAERAAAERAAAERAAAERAAAERAAAERAAAERAAAERAAATRWELSDRERAVVALLGREAP